MTVHPSATPLAVAHSLIASLHSRGHSLRVTRGKLLVGNAATLSVDDRQAITAKREELLHLLITDKQWQAREVALSRLPEVTWPGDPGHHDGLGSAGGVVILSDGHGWDVAFVAADLEAIVRVYSRLKRGAGNGPAAGGVGGLGAGAAGAVAAGPRQGDLFGGVGGAARREAGEGLREDRLPPGSRPGREEGVSSRV